MQMAAMKTTSGTWPCSLVRAMTRSEISGKRSDLVSPKSQLMP
jgi:hypothetical protein